MQTESAVFKSLLEHYKSMREVHMRDLFLDSNRFERFSLEACGLLLDYSKNRVISETMQKLVQLAEISQLPTAIDNMFQGRVVNITEKRPALHTALRNLKDPELLVDNRNILEDVRGVLAKIEAIVAKLHAAQWLGFSQKPITDVVNIGIGGSDLGPALATNALTPYHCKHLRVHFVSNIDGSHLTEVLKGLSPETTLFIVASKSFTTPETLCNAISAKNWLISASKSNLEQLQNHFIAVTAHPERATRFGIRTDYILPIWNWVGGRFSLWSAVGLAVAIAIGMQNFKALLQGAYDMDQHFKQADLANNMPVILALLSIWYINFFGINNFAVLPYDQYLYLLPAYLQQAEMESNGKNIKSNGEYVSFQTSPVVWGTVGCNGQHAFHQLLHQGTQIIPIDFIISTQAHHQLVEHHQLLVANCLSQSKALMLGKTLREVEQELAEQGMDIMSIKQLAPHKVLPGNRPSNTLFLPKQNPYTLGALLALYEHKIFVQGMIWQINSFDQWGVEFGKKITEEIYEDLGNNKLMRHHDDSTLNLIKYYKKKQQ